MVKIVIKSTENIFLISNEVANKLLSHKSEQVTDSKVHLAYFLESLIKLPGCNINKIVFFVSLFKKKKEKK
jgi:hypothetical protein